MPHRKHEVFDFYKKKESTLASLAADHFDSSEEIPRSPFSSWAASLHLVLCFAISESVQKLDPYIAVMDRLNLNEEVLVWQVPHLVYDDVCEYLACGSISGPGYTAVSLKHLELNGLFTLVPELQTQLAANDGFGDLLRNRMFEKDPQYMSRSEARIIRNLSSLFGKLSLPVAIALANIRPRKELPWTKSCNNENQNNTYLTYRKQLFESLVRKNEVPYNLSKEVWLRPGSVDTSEFADVKQWISMLLELSECGLFSAAEPIQTPSKEKIEAQHDAGDQPGDEPPNDSGIDTHPASEDDSDHAGLSEDGGDAFYLSSEEAPKQTIRTLSTPQRRPASKTTQKKQLPATKRKRVDDDDVPGTDEVGKDPTILTVSKKSAGEVKELCTLPIVTEAPWAERLRPRKKAKGK